MYQPNRSIPEYVVGDLSDWLAFVIGQGHADMLASVSIGEERVEGGQVEGGGRDGERDREDFLMGGYAAFWRR